MKNFKVGDKVKRMCKPYGMIKLGVVYTVCGYNGSQDIVLREIGGSYDKEMFELVKEEPKGFDIHSERWFIRTETREKSRAVQEWLFEKGFAWYALGPNISQVDSPYISNCQGNRSSSDKLFYGNKKEPYSQEIKEVVFNVQTKTVIESIIYPDSEAEEKRKQVLEQIAKMETELAALKALV